MPEKQKRPRILILDGDEQRSRYLIHLLEDLSCLFETAKDGRAAISKTTQFNPDLILLDFMLPLLDGMSVCRLLKKNPDTRDIPVIMLISRDDTTSKLKALDAGVADFLCRPFDKAEVAARTRNLLYLRDYAEFQKICRNLPDAAGEAGNSAELSAALLDIVRAQKSLKASYLDTIYRLTVVAEYKDEATVQHVKRVGLSCAHIARQLGWSDEQVEIIKYAAPMHDIGKIGIPSGILLKPSPLTAEEMALVKTHTVIGGKILHGSRSVYLQMAERIALSHHERWDGSGYPGAIKGDEIPLEGRIAAFADQYDSLRSIRPYKPPFDYIKAYRIMVEGNERMGPRHFDPEILEIFKDTHRAFEKIYDHHQDAPPVLL